MKKVAILQSNYIPWKGYFDLMNEVDEFVIYDEVQYTKNDWRNRNRIKTQQGVQWLTIPVRQCSLSQSIEETKVADRTWVAKHWKTIKQSYSKAAYAKEYLPIFEKIYGEMDEDFLSRVNYRLIVAINSILGIETNLRWSSDFDLVDGKTERLVDLCEKLGADVYLSGPSARNYLDESLFAEAGMVVQWMDYTGYPEYAQLFPPFEHAVSVLDLIFNEGPNATRYMKSFGHDFF